MKRIRYFVHFFFLHHGTYNNNSRASIWFQSFNSLKMIEFGRPLGRYDRCFGLLNFINFAAFSLATLWRVKQNAKLCQFKVPSALHTKICWYDDIQHFFMLQKNGKIQKSQVKAKASLLKCQAMLKCLKSDSWGGFQV